MYPETNVVAATDTAFIWPKMKEITDQADINILQKITAVTVVFNGAETIADTILSVINQTYENIEYIIIDGGSRDGTIDIIRKYEHAIDTFISEPDSGIYDAMNKGVKHSSGDWISFMNGGDTFSDLDVLKNISEALQGPSDVIYGDLEVRYVNKGSRIVISPDKVTIPLRALPVCHQSMLIKTALIRKYPFDQKYTYAADFDCLCKILKDGGRTIKVHEVISSISAGGVSRDNRIDVYRQYELIYIKLFGKDLNTTTYYKWRRMLARLKTLLIGNVT